MVGLRDPEWRQPTRNDPVLDGTHELWISAIEEDFVKVRDEEGFSFRIRTDRLSWGESGGRWGWIEDIEEESSVVNVEGDPAFNGALNRW